MLRGTRATASFQQEGEKIMIFTRAPLSQYQTQTEAQHGQYAHFTVELTSEEMAIVLQVHDYGIDAMTENEKSALYGLIATLKNKIHP